MFCNIFDDLVNTSNKEYIINRYQTRNAISFQLPNTRKNRVASSFWIQEKTLKKNRVNGYFKIKERVIERNGVAGHFEKKKRWKI